MLDGFERISSDTLTEGTALNVDAYRDSFSPYSRLDSPRPTTTDTPHIDRYYGLVYGDWIAGGGGFYGVTQDMPHYSFDDQADLGFLRVPFARFPRISVKSRRDIEQLLDQARDELPQGAQLLLRGQVREFLLPRSAETREALYGDEAGLEPSLLPSASRHGIDINGLMPEWCALLRFLLDILPPHVKPANAQEVFHHWYHSYSFSRFAFSIAQHYGLPSSGLDVTTDLDVALFFALREFSLVSKDNGTAEFLPKQTWDHSSVIYVLQVPTVWHSFGFDGVRPTDLPALRPDRQRAQFLHRGWGYAANDSANALLFALYLDEDFDAGDIPAATHLFPSVRDDAIGAGLAGFRDRVIRSPGAFSPELERLLGHLYFLADSGRPG